MTERTLRRVLVTGGAGFLGSHLCERLLADGCEVICFDNLLTGRMDNIEPLLGHPRFSFEHYDVTNFLYVAGDLDAVLHFASPASPADFERLPIQILKVGLARHAPGARPRQGEGRALPDREHLGVLRRPRSESAARDLLGPRESDRDPRGLRRGQALRRGDDDGLPPPPRGRRPHRAHLQHLRPAHAAPRRPRDPELHDPGDPRRADHGVRRRRPDALVLLRRRPDRGHPAPAAQRLRRPRQHRQPAGDEPARDGAGRSSAIADSKSELVYPRRCRPTTRRCGAPTSRWRSACSTAGSRASPVDDGLRRTYAYFEEALARESRGAT